MAEKMAARGWRATGTKFIELNVKSLANSPKSTGMEFWSINPYVGCELGCAYCYAHYAHRYVVERAQNNGKAPHEESPQSSKPKDGTAFARHIFVKQRKAVLNALERDLARVNKQSAPNNPVTVAIGTATDPYQPAERQFGITRAILERLVNAEPLTLGITTKSPLICRDIDLLSELGQRHRGRRENGTNISWPHSEPLHRTRAKPKCRSPQRRNLRTTSPMTGRQNP